MRTLALLTGLAGISAKELPPTADRQWLDELLDVPLGLPAGVPDPDSEAAQQGQAAAEALFGGPAAPTGGDR